MDELAKLILSANKIVIIQADNPDGDSLASALALEQIFGDMDMETYLYCGVEIPGYLRYLPGWDRVSKELPKDFDISVIVDNSAGSLLEALDKSGQRSWVAARPCIVIDHHAVDNSIPYATVIWNKPAVATGEVIYELAQTNNWPLNTQSRDMMAIAIMSDSLGLISEGTSSRSIHIIAELVDSGVSLAKIDSARRDLMRKSPELLRYKGQLLQRLEFYKDNQIVLVTIPWQEIERYSHAYNPSMLVIDDMRMAEGASIAIAFKTYPDGKITAKIRSNYNVAIAGELAKHFGGGGHPYASGFKISDGRSFETIKAECLDLAGELLDKTSWDHTQ